MRHRHPARPLPRSWPSVWLMTDERQGARLWAALDALPRGSGVMFRHHATPPAERAALCDRVQAKVRRRRLLVIREEQAGPRIARVHSLREAVAARRNGAALLFVSPVFATRTHPGAASLGPVRAARIARQAGVPAIALGGMDARQFRHMRRLGFSGWAAIDSLTPD